MLLLNGLVKDSAAVVVRLIPEFDLSWWCDRGGDRITKAEAVKRDRSSDSARRRWI